MALETLQDNNSCPYSLCLTNRGVISGMRILLALRVNDGQCTQRRCTARRGLPSVSLMHLIKKYACFGLFDNRMNEVIYLITLMAQIS